jgi:hypothetical protein
MRSKIGTYFTVVLTFDVAGFVPTIRYEYVFPSSGERTVDAKNGTVSEAAACASRVA